MNITTSSIAALLVELAHIGVEASVKGDRISLHPASRMSPELLACLCTRKAELMQLLLNRRLRWRSQAETLIADVAADDPEDLLYTFAEREALAAIDGGLDDETAGRLAYQQVVSELGHDPVRTPAIGETP